MSRGRFNEKRGADPPTLAGNRACAASAHRESQFWAASAARGIFGSPPPWCPLSPGESVLWVRPPEQRSPCPVRTVGWQSGRVLPLWLRSQPPCCFDAGKTGLGEPAGLCPQQQGTGPSGRPTSAQAPVGMDVSLGESRAGAACSPHGGGLAGWGGRESGEVGPGRRGRGARWTPSWSQPGTLLTLVSLTHAEEPDSGNTHHTRSSGSQG